MLKSLWRNYHFAGYRRQLLLITFRRLKFSGKFHQSKKPYSSNFRDWKQYGNILICFSEICFWSALAHVSNPSLAKILQQQSLFKGPNILASSIVLIISKVVPIMKCTCTVFIDNFRNISTNSSIQVSVCRGSYDGYMKHKRNNPTCDPWDSQGN